MKDYKAILAKQRESFISERSAQEHDFASFYKSVIELNERHPELFEDMPELFSNTDMTLQDFIPELYKDDIDAAVYAQQYENLCALIGRVQARIVQYNTEISGVTTSDISTIAETNRRNREAFITERSRQEMLVKSWNDKIQNTKSEKIKALGLPEEMSLEYFIPEYYKETINEELKHQQYLNMMSVIERVNAIVDEHLQEVEKCLSEYQELSLQRN